MFSKKKRFSRVYLLKVYKQGRSYRRRITRINGTEPPTCIRRNNNFKFAQQFIGLSLVSNEWPKKSLDTEPPLGQATPLYKKYI